MILNYMHSNPILEQGMPGEESELDNSSPFPEAEPLKKYELLFKLNRMRNILKASNIYNEDLDIVLDFGAELSYETLLALSNSIIERISKQISGMENNEKKKE